MSLYRTAPVQGCLGVTGYGRPASLQNDLEHEVDQGLVHMTFCILQPFSRITEALVSGFVCAPAGGRRGGVGALGVPLWGGLAGPQASRMSFRRWSQITQAMKFDGRCAGMRALLNLQGRKRLGHDNGM